MIVVFNIELQEIRSMGAGNFNYQDVLAYLDVDAQSPSLAYLQQLMQAYTRTVPWESASRIAKRARTPQTALCPRFPQEFWRDALRYGTGGTCYESNLAFFTLLKSLGFEGYLTINNMTESVGCHSAEVIFLDGQKYLVDVGLPIYAPLLISESEAVQTASPFHTYTITPQGNERYEISRDNHFRAYCFTLIDIPINDIDYRATTTDDYGEDGLFLDRIVMHLVVDGVQWRFGSDTLPYQMEKFVDGEKSYYLMDGDLKSVATQVGNKFGLDEDILYNALVVLEGKQA